MSERTIFLSALEISDAGDRTEFVERECGGNPELLRQVQALLAAHDHAGEFLEKPAVALPPGGSKVAAATSADPTQEFRSDEVTKGFPFLAPSQRPDAIGRLSHYEILAPLGKGAFGSVFKAFDTRLDRIVAVKILSPELAASGGARPRFIREAKAAASVRHEHVVDIHAVDEEPIPYLVMECIIGQTLQQKIDRTGALPVLEILRIGYQIASGLSAAHALGLIHRDIKPANILLENGVERVKITDFGLARAGDDASLTQSGIVCGTPMYMAPEQAQGEPLDTRADLFSLGSTLYAMCTGRPPFRATTTMAVLKRVIDDQPRPIREINPDMPEWLCEIVEKLLEKRPQDRFASASEVATLLSRHLAHQQHPATTPAPPRVGRVRAESPKLTDEDIESGSDILGAILVFLPIWSLLLALDGAFRKAMPGPLLRAPEDVGRTLMVCFGFLAACAFALSRWVPKGGWRNVTSSLAGAALLVAVAEGMHWIRIGEPTAPAVAYDSSRSLGGTSSPSLSPDPAHDLAEAAWVDMLRNDEVQAIAGKTIGVRNSNGRLVVTPTTQNPFVSLALTPFPFRDGRIRVRAVCRQRTRGMIFGAGMQFEPNSSRRIEASLRGGDAVNPPAGFQIWEFDQNAKITPLEGNAGVMVAAGTEVDLRIEVKGNLFRARIGGRELDATRPRPRPAGEEAVPFLGIAGSEWEIVEWKVLSDDKAGPVDLLNWGRLVDPTGESALNRAYSHMTLEIPATRPFSLSPLPGHNLNAPRLLQEIEGDFEMSVAIPPSASPQPGTAGLLLWQDEKNFLLFERGAYGEQGQGAPFLQAELFVDGKTQKDEGERFPGAPAGTTHLKLHRWRDQVQLFRSDDGLEWTLWRTLGNCPLSRQLQVGLVLQTTTSAKASQKFERFRLRAQEVSTKSPGESGGDGVAMLNVSGVDAKTRQLRVQESQNATAKKLGVSVEYANTVDMKLRLIPPGEFTMGMSVDEINDVLKRPHQAGLDQNLLKFMTHACGPQHKVRVTRPYYVGATEVTVGQFRQFVKETGYQPKDIPENEADVPLWVKPATNSSEELPATRVTWHEARRFCRWLSEKEGIEYALPTEAQWEFACRAGVPEIWSFGDDRSEVAEYAWFGLGYHDLPKPVGTKKPNGFGLFDMHGNAHEWVEDWHQRDFFVESPILDPVCTKPGVGRVCRGGWWWDSADLIRSASRSYNMPDVRYPGNGFRVAIVPPFDKLAKPAAKTETTQAAKPTLSAPLDFFGSLIGQGGFFSLAATADGKQVIAGTYQGKIGLWNTVTREQVRVIDAHDKTIHSLVVTPDQQHIVSAAEDGTIRMWNRETGEKVREFTGHTTRVDSLDLVGGGSTLISASADFPRSGDQSIRTWNLQTGEQVKAFTGEVGVVGRLVALGSTGRAVSADFAGQRVTLWDAAEGTALRFAPARSIQTLASATDGKTFVSGHAAEKLVDGKWDDPDNCVLRIWNAETLEPGLTLQGHRGPVASVAFSPNGQQIASVSGGAHGADGEYHDAVEMSLRVRDVLTGKELATHVSPDRLLSVVYLPSGEIVTGGNGHLRLHKLQVNNSKARD